MANNFDITCYRGRSLESLIALKAKAESDIDNGVDPINSVGTPDFNTTFNTTGDLTPEQKLKAALWALQMLDEATYGSWLIRPGRKYIV